MSRTDRDVYGFETKFADLSPQLLNMSMMEYIAFLQALHFDRFVLLMRKNYLRALLSALVASATKTWHSASSPIVPTKVTIDVSQPHPWTGSLIQILEWTDIQAQQWLRATEACERLSLTYEDDVEVSPLIGYQKMCGFLGIPVESVAVRLKRTNPFDLESIIANYSDVEVALRGTRFEWMLE